MSAAHDAETIMRRMLDGRFFLIDGRDANVVKREREALRAADRAIAESKAKGRRRQLMAQNAARMELQELDARQLTPRKILVAVSYAHGIPIADILGPSRNRNIVFARQHACHAMRFLAKMKFPAIGDELARDHTTVLHSCETFECAKHVFAKQIALVNSILLDGKEVGA